MRTRLHILRIALATALTVALVVPAQSLADYYVPPENSAANQYTESFPGAGGEKAGKGQKATPADTLGSRNAKRLEERGPAGKAAAEVAAETAPSQAPAGGGANGGEAGGGSTGSGAGVGGSGGGSGSGGTAAANSGSGSADRGAGGVGQSTKVDQPQGSSGLSHVLGQATGVGDGNVGIWLPLVILLTLAGSIAYAVRARQPRHGHSA
ncbi:MAG TPA: hypothetical protein VJU14_04440 [Solirubrobacterales bacterium]|nr:hypothetical protein [Solirubrobacterales bacterium]